MNKFAKRGLLSMLVMMMLLMASCTSYKKVPYLQNSREYSQAVAEAVAYEPVIMPQDLLTITVVNPNDVAASMAYNLISPSDINRHTSLTSQPTLQNYIVENDGYVSIPSVGRLKVGGLTIPQAEKLVRESVKGFSSEPVVTVRFVDFKVSVLGEVTAPGSYTVKNGKVNIFQALALARDLTVYGMRDNVKVIREGSDGAKEIVELNLNDAEILNSPYYYLQQNDVVYVTPNESKARNSDIGSSTSLWFSGTSILISLTSLLYNILK